ncbi:hypothetical protein CDD81_4228 [Ophiocordyceps australis]|uniref:Pyridoxamine 5'-phosphate oxidase Alr4036 family FMN-binding domain-containing protein n=1 Tax=Ophiocordyceps australis TaxID=1399860 RepID=A0A2C5Y7D8_9HYPO|nr:hypothetical protein CDD81_4228 [Ophiocordyceps australis]
MAPANNPWGHIFLSHMDKADAPTFTLASLHRSGSTLLPRARSVIYRGMWACLPDNAKNQTQRNPKAYTSYMPTFTTDARMEKVQDLMSSASPDLQDSCTKKQSFESSGGGGPVEAVFWIPETSTQWRLRGRAYLVGPDIESDAAAPVRDALLPFMHPLDSGSGSEAYSSNWNWNRELTAHFGNLSPLMRGSFRGPPPGTPATGPRDNGQGLGQRVTDVNDAAARANFRVVVIVPEEVDRIDLSNPEEGHRWNYKLNTCAQHAATWKETVLWP